MSSSIEIGTILNHALCKSALFKSTLFKNLLYLIKIFATNTLPYLLIGNPVTDGIIFGYDDHFGLVWTLLHNGICLQPFAQFHSFPLDGFR